MPSRDVHLSHLPGRPDTGRREPISGATQHNTGRWWPPLVAVVPLLILTPGLLGQVTLEQDEGLLLTYPSLILSGLWPNTDFVSVYGINNLLVLAGSYAVFGQSLIVERLVGLVFRVVIVVGVTDMTRRSAGSKVAAFAGVISSLVLSTTGLVAYAWIGAVAVGVVAIWLCANANLNDPVKADLFPWLVGGLAMGFRIDIGLAVIAGLLVARGRVPTWSALRLMGLGLAVGLSPSILHAVVADNVVRDMVVKPIFNGGGRRLPLIASGSLLAYTMLVLAGVAVVIIAVVARRALRNTPAWRNMAALGIFATFLLPQMFQRLDDVHVAFVTCVLLPAAVAAGAFMFRTHPNKHSVRSTGSYAFGAFAFTALAATGFVPTLEEPIDDARVFYSGAEPKRIELTGGQNRSILVWRSGATGLERLVQSVQAIVSPTCNRLVVGPSDLRFAVHSDTFFHWLLPETRPGSRFLEFNPGDANGEDSSLADDLATTDLVIVNEDFVSWGEPNASSLPGPNRPNVVLKERFTQVGQFDRRKLLVADTCLNGQ